MGRSRRANAWRERGGRDLNEAGGTGARHNPSDLLPGKIVRPREGGVATHGAAFHVVSFNGHESETLQLFHLPAYTYVVSQQGILVGVIVYDRVLTRVNLTPFHAEVFRQVVQGVKAA